MDLNTYELDKDKDKGQKNYSFIRKRLQTKETLLI
jgi:hypothetical protein